jgi:hypothetical protein
MSGGNFNPHVSTGVAPKEHLDKMLAESFENFTSSPTGAAVYQLGPFGSASGQPSPSLSSILLFPSQILSPPPTLI